jgi:hypothetical protein
MNVVVALYGVPSISGVNWWTDEEQFGHISLENDKFA